MAAPADARYSETHEWHKLDGDVLTLGLTQFAVNELTDITYVEIKPAGTKLTGGDTIGEVESVKATSDVYTALPGEIIEVNDKLDEDPSLINSDPYGAGWLVKIKADDTSGFDALMDSETYSGQYDA
jgi:glycine cleavage system H protein